MGLYEELTWVDVVEPLLGMLKRGDLQWDVERGKVVIPVSPRWDYPWIMGKATDDRRCALWLEFYFNVYGLFPKGCRKCWKVVARPRTVKELFGMMQLQKEQDIPGKCGMENRSYTRGAVFGAYWYLPLGIGKGEAVALKRKIQREVAESVGVGIPFVLKRGCTEIELRFGRSDQWEKEKVWAGMDQKEELLDAVLEMDTTKHPQPGMLVTNIQRKWIERAWREGDPTVWEFAEEESFPSKLVNYDEVEEVLHVVR